MLIPPARCLRLELFTTRRDSVAPPRLANHFATEIRIKKFVEWYRCKEKRRIVVQNSKLPYQNRSNRRFELQEY